MEARHTMAVTYMAALERLGRKAQLTLDKKRGTELIRRENGDVVIRHHGDPVVTIHPGDEYTIRTGFQASATKRRRIAEYSPISVIIKKGGLWAQRTSGEVMPFIEGMRVTIQGQPIDSASIAAGHGAVPVGGNSGGAGKGTETVPPEDVRRLKMFIRREVRDYMHEIGVSAATSLTPTPTRVMSLRGQVRKISGGQDVIPSLLPLIEQMLVGAGVPPQKARQAVKDTHGALYRGRDVEAPPLELPPVQEPEAPANKATLSAMEEAAGKVLCPKCQTPVVAHFDTANRRRGCEYAMEHSDDLKILE
jgi:hypothetical protein